MISAYVPTLRTAGSILTETAIIQLNMILFEALNNLVMFQTTDLRTALWRSGLDYSELPGKLSEHGA